jgi:hypothetical protein
MTAGMHKHLTDTRAKRIDYKAWLERQLKITNTEIADIDNQLKEPVSK